MSYIHIPNVPILDEHVATLPGGKKHRVDKRELQKIAARGNQRIRDTGDYCPIVIGHTKDDQPEHKQPEVVGLAGPFRVKKLKRTGRWAIHSLFRIQESKADKARDYPRRSVELWPSRHEIDPISLLGATTPERDLGLLKYDRGTKHLHYSRSIGDPMPVDPADKDPKKPEAAGAAPKSEADNIAAKVFEMLKESDVWKWAQAQMEQDDSGQDADMLPEGEGDMMPEGDDGFDLGLGDLDGEDQGDDMPPMPPKQGESLKANAGAPGGSNTHTPDDNLRMSRRDEERHQYMRAHEDMARELTDLRLRFQRTEREKDLIQLEGEGYAFDRVEELDHVTAMPDDQYVRHLNTIRKRYQRAPVRQPSWASNTANPTRPGNRSKEQVDQIVRYAREKGLSYDDAAKACEGERVL